MVAVPPIRIRAVLLIPFLLGGDMPLFIGKSIAIVL